VLIVASAVAVVGSGAIRRAKVGSARRSVATRAGGGGKKRRQAETKAGVPVKREGADVNSRAAAETNLADGANPASRTFGQRWT
jgi:hypothetical protein